MVKCFKVTSSSSSLFSLGLNRLFFLNHDHRTLRGQQFSQKNLVHLKKNYPHKTCVDLNSLMDISHSLFRQPLSDLFDFKLTHLFSIILFTIFHRNDHIPLCQGLI